MPRIQTVDLIGQHLDWAVAKIQGWELHTGTNPWGLEYWMEKLDKAGISRRQMWELTYSLSGSLAQSIIEDNAISVIRCNDDYEVDSKGFCTNKRIAVWAATDGEHNQEESTEHQQHDAMYQIYLNDVVYGPTFLVAAMRRFVMKKLGASVDVPEVLMKERLK